MLHYLLFLEITICRTDYPKLFPLSFHYFFLSLSYNIGGLPEAFPLPRFCLLTYLLELQGFFFFFFYLHYEREIRDNILKDFFPALNCIYLSQYTKLLTIQFYCINTFWAKANQELYWISVGKAAPVYLIVLVSYWWCNKLPQIQGLNTNSLTFNSAG